MTLTFDRGGSGFWVMYRNVAVPKPSNDLLWITLWGCCYYTPFGVISLRDSPSDEDRP